MSFFHQVEESSYPLVFVPCEMRQRSSSPLSDSGLVHSERFRWGLAYGAELQFA